METFRLIMQIIEVFGWKAVGLTVVKIILLFVTIVSVCTLIDLYYCKYVKGEQLKK